MSEQSVSLQGGKRPLLLSIVLWVLIALCAFSLLVMALVLMNYEQAMTSMPQLVDVLTKEVLYFSMAAALINLLLSILMLKGVNWARYTYVILGALNYLYQLVTTPQNMSSDIFGIAIFIVIIVILFLPASNRYFSRKN